MFLNSRKISVVLRIFEKSKSKRFNCWFSLIDFRHWLKIRTYSNLRKRSRDENWSSLLLHWLHSILEKLIRNRDDSFNTFTSGTSDWDVFTCSDDQTWTKHAMFIWSIRIQNKVAFYIPLNNGLCPSENVRELKDFVISISLACMGPKG